MTVFRRRGFVHETRQITEARCLKLARAFALGGRVEEFAVLIHETAFGAAAMHAWEGRPNA